MSKCLGCGIKLQKDNKTLPGYIVNDDNVYCQRCFKIKNYNKLESDNKYIDNKLLINKINAKKAFTFFLCDFLALNEEVVNYYNLITNPKIFVVTKCDILPDNIHLSHLKENIAKSYDIKDLILFSIVTELNKNDIIKIIQREKSVIISGPTNGGKSSLINYLTDSNITVSNYKNTTQDFIRVNYEDYQLLDAPGFNTPYLKDKIKYKGKIKPKTLTLKKGYSLFIDEYEIKSFDNLTLYFPNEVEITTKKSESVLENSIKCLGKCDIVLNNLGFLYLNNGLVMINKLDYVSKRKSVIGGK